MSDELSELERWQAEHPDATEEEFDSMLTERGYSEPMTADEFIKKLVNGGVNTPASAG